MLQIIPGSLRTRSNEEASCKYQNNASGESIREIMQKLLRPTRVVLPEMLEVPVVGELTQQLLNAFHGWSLFVNRARYCRCYRGPVEHSVVHGFLYRSVRRHLPPCCFMRRENLSRFRLYILYLACDSFVRNVFCAFSLTVCVRIHLRHFVSMPVDGYMSVGWLCRSLKVMAIKRDCHC